MGGESNEKLCRAGKATADFCPYPENGELPGRGETACWIYGRIVRFDDDYYDEPALLRAAPAILSYATRCQTYPKPAN